MGWNHEITAAACFTGRCFRIQHLLVQSAIIKCIHQLAQVCILIKNRNWLQGWTSELNKNHICTAYMNTHTHRMQAHSLYLVNNRLTKGNFTKIKLSLKYFIDIARTRSNLTPPAQQTNASPRCVRAFLPLHPYVFYKFVYRCLCEVKAIRKSKNWQKWYIL